MQRSGLVYVGVLVVLVAIAVGLILSVSSFEFQRRPWNAFDVVLVPERHDLAAVHSALVDHGLEPIDATNATVRVEDYNGQEEVRVAEIPDRFDELDPRIDPFIRAVPNLFRVRHGGRGYHVLYLQQTHGMIDGYRRVRTAIDEFEFLLAGWQPLTWMVTAGATFLIVLIVTVVMRRRVLLMVSIALIAVVYVAAHGPSAFMRGAMTALAVLYVAFHGRNIEREWLLYRGPIVLQRHHVQTLLFLILTLVASAVMIAVETDGDRTAAAISYVAYLLALGGTYGIAVVVERRRLRRSEHPLFSPRPILGDVWRRRQRRLEVFPGALAAVFLIVVVATAVTVYSPGSAAAGDVYLPVPDHRLAEPGPVDTEADGETFLRAVATIDVASDPLSVAGFIAHRRFQSSFLYGGQFAPPSPGETVALRRFRRDGDRIEAFEEERVRFDGTWVREELSVASPSVYALFAREGGVFSVVLEPLYAPSFSYDVALIHIILLFFALLPVLIRIRLPYRDALGTVAVASRSERR